MDKRLKTIRKIETSNFQASEIEGTKQKSLARSLEFLKIQKAS